MQETGEEAAGGYSTAPLTPKAEDLLPLLSEPGTSERTPMPDAATPVAEMMKQESRGPRDSQRASNKNSREAVIKDGDRDSKKNPRGNSSQNSETRSQARSDASDNNCCDLLALPCCRKRKCVCPSDCPPGMVRMCHDPCCCSPCMPTPFADHKRLKEENKALKQCIKRIKKGAISEACDIIKDVLADCKCSCCTARDKLRPCKSVTAIPGRETWLCVPMPGSSRCGGYTPSGWGRMLKKCQDITCDPCAACDVTGCVTPCVNLRCQCLPVSRPCPPCPHLCPIRALPSALRPYTPCCPLYFPCYELCCSKSHASTHTPKSACSRKSCTSTPSCCRLVASGTGSHCSGVYCCGGIGSSSCGAMRPCRMPPCCKARCTSSGSALASMSAPAGLPKCEPACAAVGMVGSPSHSPVKGESPTLPMSR